MRAALTIALLVLLTSLATSFAGADELPDEQPIPWQEPFEAISASKAQEALVLMVITNEDPFEVRESSEPAKESDAEEIADQNPPIWCANVLAMAYRNAIERRPDLRGRLMLQSIVAGLPKELTGGQPRNNPSRAVVALCDGDYRLLALNIGVPDVKDLMTLIEDGEEVATIRQLHTDDAGQVVKAISERSRRRLSRLWQRTLADTLAMMQGELRDGEETGGVQPFFQGLMRSLGDTFEQTYIADVKLRFGLIETSDRTRLIILEQHSEARRPWCETMIPFAAGCKMPDVWRELVESVWGHQPITSDVDAQELLDWYDLQSTTEVVVLSLRSPLRSRREPWPPVAGKFSRRGVSWQEAHTLALQRPFREVDPQQFATLIHARDLATVDIEQPSTLRYMLLDPKKRAPVVIRENDSPGRFVGILKRTKLNPARP